MSGPITLPEPANVDDPAVLAERAAVYDFPIFQKMNPRARVAWVRAKAIELAGQSTLEDKKLAWTTALECAKCMAMSGLAFESIMLTEAPKPNECVKATNAASKIPRYLAALGIEVKFSISNKGAGSDAGGDPFGDE